MLGYESLETHFKLNFHMHYKYNFSIEMLERMLPFEREVYMNLLAAQLKKEKKERN